MSSSPINPATTERRSRGMSKINLNFLWMLPKDYFHQCHRMELRAQHWRFHGRWLDAQNYKGTMNAWDTKISWESLHTLLESPDALP